MNVRPICISGALRGHKKASDSPELELQMVVSHHMGARIEPGSSTRATSALNSKPSLQTP